MMLIPIGEKMQMHIDFCVKDRLSLVGHLNGFPQEKTFGEHLKMHDTWVTAVLIHVAGY
ncbi:hypothetical protein D3C75_1109410 [compost metagenome]